MGLAALLHASALAFQTLKYLGVVYLFYMAWSTLREQGAFRVEGEIGPRSASRVITHAVLINILNPKLSIFFLAFLPQFVRADEPRPLARMLELSRPVDQEAGAGVSANQRARRSLLIAVDGATRRVKVSRRS
jgi:threonine/homoserine/homoserine lactone efflux protein